MKKFTKTVSAFLVALSMAVMPVTTQADNHNGGRQSHFSSSQSNGAGHKPRPSGGNNGTQQGGNRPGNNSGSHRPGNGNNGSNHRPGNNGGSHRPGNGNNGGNNRPGNNGGSHRPGNGNNGSNHRPGNNGSSHRPGNGNNGSNHRPGNGGNHNWKPNHGGNAGHRPGGDHRPGRPTPPPPASHRPHRPVYFGSGHHNHHVPFFGTYHRPVPPPAWRPVAYGPSFGTILGVAFGTSVNLTLQALLNSGYNVTSYGNNVVYLTNVPQMNYYWPDAAMYYNNGALCGSTFTYPSTYYDMSRYNALYNTFCGQYGMPVSSVNQGGIISSTWFGNGNRYVTLEFNSNYGNYYTSLSFGM